VSNITFGGLSREVTRRVQREEKELEVFLSSNHKCRICCTMEVNSTQKGDVLHWSKVHFLFSCIFILQIYYAEELAVVNHKCRICCTMEVNGT